MHEVTDSRPDLATLLERVRACTGPDNALDMEIEMALFEPDHKHVSLGANAAGTKLIYKRADGRQETFWAADYTLTPTSRQTAIDQLTATLTQESTNV